jgi:hypothetical protein
MNTIVAAEQLDRRNSFTIAHQGHAEWLHSRSYFINVPVGTPALRVDVAIADGNVMPSLTRPNSRFYYSLPPDQFPVRFTRYQNAGTWSRVVSNPDPGVWQISVDNCNTLEAGVKHESATFQVTATLLGVSVSEQRSSDDLESRIVFSNTHGAFAGGVATTALASTFAATNAILKNSEPVIYDIDVAPGATRVGATLTANDNSSADLDLYLFDCTGAQCVLRDFSTGDGSFEQVAVDAPAAGKWKVVVDPFSAPNSGIMYQYKDYFLHPAVGQLAAHDQLTAGDSQRRVEPGAVITQPVSLNIKAMPVGERYLEAIVFVTSGLGPNSDTTKAPDQLEPYYADKAILGTAFMQLKRVNVSSTGK